MNWNLHGHDWAVNLLQTHVAEDNLRHAYLLAGPQGVGRRTLAVRFAQAFNCTQTETPGDFCGTCRDCRQMAALTHPDLSLLQPVEGHKDILIDQVRELQHTLALSPYSARYRVALLPDFQRANESASNALLKTLEEPSEKVILLLTADALENLLPTIVSRCEVIRLRPASIASAQAYLQSTYHLNPEQARLLAHISGGRIGIAVALLEDPEALSLRKDRLMQFLELLSAPRYERFSLAEAISKPYDKARSNASEIIPVWLSFWRDVFVRANGADLPLINLDFAAQVSQTARVLNPAEARQLIIAHEETLEMLDANANVRLLLETLMLQWPYLVQPLAIE